ncbi:hypothetical protein I4F81_011279 [Pyropia yezoensis]|uniref:Uncharacterized protein n=1 Tax=Pyropia yezoensis TaxID=2788 RepID=A0ACC3CFM0_PYRYE|nr:hypothetical protein I4F81_011279 [Neopyropia yezoensis]
MKKGTPARYDRKPPLTGADFVCEFVTDSDVRQILENCVNVATEAALGKVRDTGKGVKTSKFDDVHVVSDSSGSADRGPVDVSTSSAPPADE